MNNNKLSKQQKAILEELSKSKYKSLWVSYLSRKIAHRFNKGHNDRIWTSKGAMLKEREELKKDIEENKLSEKEIKNRYSMMSMMGSFMFKIHRRNEILTPKHRASFSRSLERLEKRSLIYRRRSWSDNNVRTLSVSLTEKGKKTCQNLGFN